MCKGLLVKLHSCPCLEHSITSPSLASAAKTSATLSLRSGKFLKAVIKLVQRAFVSPAKLPKPDQERKRDEE